MPFSHSHCSSTVHPSIWAAKYSKSLFPLPSSGLRSRLYTLYYLLVSSNLLSHLPPATPQPRGLSRSLSTTLPPNLPTISLRTRRHQHPAACMFENQVDVEIALLDISAIYHKLSNVRKDFTIQQQHTHCQRLAPDVAAKENIFLSTFLAVIG